jgi:hypothetical protein
VQPNRVQHALYGPTLDEYLHADLIGKTLVEKTSAKRVDEAVDLAEPFARIQSAVSEHRKLGVSNRAA